VALRAIFLIMFGGGSGGEVADAFTLLVAQGADRSMSRSTAVGPCEPSSSMREPEHLRQFVRRMRA